jgi:hypothetical protein
MNTNKLNQLLAAARNESAPAAPADFAAEVLRAVHRDARFAAEPASAWAPLNALFARVAVAAAAIIILSVAADWGMTVAGVPGLADGAAQVTSQYLFNSEDL